MKKQEEPQYSADVYIGKGGDGGNIISTVVVTAIIVAAIGLLLASFLAEKENSSPQCVDHGVVVACPPLVSGVFPLPNNTGNYSVLIMGDS